MAREVDRLLAHLADFGRPSGPVPESGGRSATRPAIRRPRVAGSGASAAGAPRRALVALWGRVLLAAALGAVMTQWPYPHPCGLPLLGYLGAVAAVMLAGAWIAFASWRLHRGVAHILSLILFYWGIVLAAEQLLPRIGYAAEPAVWRCGPG